jgi:glutamine cyclotransferase
MKKHIIVGVILIVTSALMLALSCSDVNDDSNNHEETPPALFLFKDNLATVVNESVKLEIQVNEKIKKMELFYNDSLMKTWNNPNGKISYELNSGQFGVGARTLNLLSTRQDGSTFVDNRMVRVFSDVIPEKRIVSIIDQHPHDPTSFTQGLEFYEGKLYEGTGDPGNQGKTLVAEVDLLSGVKKQEMGLDVGYFGEGITIMEKLLYQLTWQNEKCYTYAVDSNLKLVGEFNYRGEGWGLCNNGTSLIMSNGTERITYRDPKTFAIEKTIEVYNNHGPINYLNELEFIDGKIYANVWTTNMVVVIDPQTGKVLQEIDGTPLVRQVKGAGEALNGIAHDSSTGKIYMTGKNWSKLFEVEFVAQGS